MKYRISLAKEVMMTLPLAETYPQSLDDLAQKGQLRPNTLRAYRYELAAAAQDSRFQIPLPNLELNLIEDWVGRGHPAPSTRSRERRPSTASSGGFTAGNVRAQPGGRARFIVTQPQE